MSGMADGKKERRQRRNFTDEFKAQVVKRVVSGEKTAAQVARDLDLTESAVRLWVRQHQVDGGKGPPGALTTAEREELARLRKENRELKEDREILKKAALHSTGGRNTAGYPRPGRAESEHLSGAAIQPDCDDVQVVLAERREVNA